MNISELSAIACRSVLIASVIIVYAPHALAQTAEATAPKKIEKKKDSAQQQRERAIARCRENRGVDCDTAEGLKEWIEQERPITDEERARAAAARRARQAEERRARDATRRN